MRKNSVVLDFLKFSVPNKVIFGRTVNAKMSVIDLFKDSIVPYDVSNAIIAKLESTYMSSRSGDHEQIALMHQAEIEFDDIYRKVGYNVNFQANGDEAIILSTGFHLAKQPAPSEKPEFTVETGTVPGSIKLKRKAVEGASSYVWQYYIGTDTPSENDWLFGSSTTQATYEMTGLPSVTKGWFRVAAVTPAGMQPFTDAIMKVIP